MYTLNANTNTNTNSCIVYSYFYTYIYMQWQSWLLRVSNHSEDRITRYQSSKAWHQEELSNKNTNKLWFNFLATRWDAWNCGRSGGNPTKGQFWGKSARVSGSSFCNCQYSNNSFEIVDNTMNEWKYERCILRRWIIDLCRSTVVWGDFAVILGIINPAMNFAII